MQHLAKKYVESFKPDIPPMRLAAPRSSYLDGPFSKTIKKLLVNALDSGKPFTQEDLNEELGLERDWKPVW